MSDDFKQYELVRPLAKKIISLNDRMVTITEKYENMIFRKNEFFDDVKKEHIYFAILCILALIFDFFISKITMKPLAKIAHLRPEAVALIFNFMDAVVAVLASGILVKNIHDHISLKMQKRVWLTILWALFAVKITLFTITAKNQGTNWKATLLIVFLTIIVYSILHFAGSGLHYLFNIVKYWLLIMWNDDPKEVQIELKNYIQKFKQEVNKYNFDLKSINSFFGLEGIVK
jgi:hypothetical protein